MTLSIEEAKELFLSFGKSQRGYSPNTVRNYSKAIDRFARTISDTEKLDISLINIAHFDRFGAILKDERNDTITIRGKLIALRSLFGFLRKRGYISVNPSADVELPRLKRKHMRSPTEDHRNALVNAPNEEKWLECRDKLIFLLGFGSGLRRSDLWDLKVRNIDFDNNSAHVVGKGGVEDEIYFNEETKRVLLKYLQTRKVADGRHEFEHLEFKEYVLLNRSGKRLKLESIDRIVRTWRRHLGLPEWITTHSLRRYFAKTWLDAAGSLRSLQLVMRHQSPNTTVMYDDTPRGRAKSDYMKMQGFTSNEKTMVDENAPVKKAKRSIIPDNL